MFDDCTSETVCNVSNVPETLLVIWIYLVFSVCGVNAFHSRARGNNNDNAQ